MDDKKKKLAEKGIAFLRQDLAKKYGYIAPAIFFLKPVEDVKEKNMSTDAVHLFYNADYIISRFTEEKKAYQELQFRYLHIMIHCLAGHVNKKIRAEDVLYDQCADFYAELLLNRLTGKRKKLLPEARQAYAKAKKLAEGKSLNGFVNECRSDEEKQRMMGLLEKNLASDTHQYWTTENPIIEALISANALGGKTAGDDWEWIRQQIQSQSGESNRKRYGDEAGNETTSISAAEENASNYKEMLQELCNIREIPADDIWEYDYAWYRTGMQIYGNKPILEANECVERKKIEDLIIAVDISGSCINLASRFLRETLTIIRDASRGRKRFRIWFVECDCEIKRVSLITSEDEIPDFKNYKMQGWGGTSFIPVFDFIQDKLETQEMEEVTALLYFTDGYGEFPEKEPEYSTIFILPMPYSEYERVELPKWSDSFFLTEEALEHGFTEEEKRWKV